MEAICHRFNKHWSVSLSDFTNSFDHRFTDLYQIHTIDLYRWNLVRLGRTVNILASGVGPVYFSPHTVEIIFKHKNNR